MKGKYITTQILLACLSKPVTKKNTRSLPQGTRVIITGKVLEPLLKSSLAEA